MPNKLLMGTSEGLFKLVDRSRCEKCGRAAPGNFSLIANSMWNEFQAELWSSFSANEGITSLIITGVPH
jgi:hypothetical protein